MASSCEDLREPGNSRVNLSSKFSTLGLFFPITLSKFLWLERRSVFALIKSAFAPASDDSDWAKSTNVISPFCNLALSNSTCLSNNFTFEITW